ncbi:hypothetical protein niasHT_009411 [Heterodera trifolii]|uniref:Uncharacterized protein n=1 Tax=Heterodera trifolii TaxID=157864 RepID=A0ABD2MEC4_9BILA
MMLWGSPSPISTDETKEKIGHDDSHLELIKGDISEIGMEPSSVGGTSAGHNAKPFFALDQLKQAGVPLKAQINPYLQLDPSIFKESQPQIIMTEGYEFWSGKI